MRRVVLRRKIMKNDGWTSVRDGLPDCELFLAVYNGSFKEIEVIASHRGFVTAENNEFLGWDGSFVEGFADWGGRPFRFTHWMPLPEMPEEL